MNSLSGILDALRALLLVLTASATSQTRKPVAAVRIEEIRALLPSCCKEIVGAFAVSSEEEDNEQLQSNRLEFLLDSLFFATEIAIRGLLRIGFC